MPDEPIGDVIRKIKSIPCEEMRRETKTYFEAVFATEAMERVKPILESHYGPAFKRVGVRSGPEMDEFCREYGGIQKDQELYYANRSGVMHLAMIWPWQDGRRVTLKVIESH